MKISEMNEAQRPRERALAEGVKVLSDAELLAVLLRTGISGGESALDLSHRLLSMAGGSLAELSRRPVGDFCAIPGIKENKAVIVMAAFELGRRFCEEKAAFSDEPVTSSRQAYDILIPGMRGLDHEECKVLYLNRSQCFLGLETITTGGPASTAFDAPYIVRKALEKNASYVILAHNHPSGNPRPSKPDIKYTKAVRDSLAVMDIGMVDHIIISDGRYYSFADDRLITPK